MWMEKRKPNEATSHRAPDGDGGSDPGEIREPRVRAALRERRRRRADEGRFQSLVRSMATQMSSIRDR
jgi:hypothetical protein